MFNRCLNFADLTGVKFDKAIRTVSSRVTNPFRWTDLTGVKFDKAIRTKCSCVTNPFRRTDLTGVNFGYYLLALERKKKRKNQKEKLCVSYSL